MTDPSSELRIRELKRRVTQDATSPLFIGLAEEYRACGRLSDAIRTLEKGIQTHPHYVSAKVALARAYLEAGYVGDAAALFSKVLGLDPGNLISARSLAEIHLSQGNRLEAVKKYKLYRALSGDRGVDEVIDRIEGEIPPAPPPAEAPAGRALAGLYLEQGHSAEALAIYDELAGADPADTEVSRLRAEVAARLPEAGFVAAPPGAPPRGQDWSGREARVLALKRWLSVIQTR